MAAVNVVLIEPAFRHGIISNPETAGDNFFQHHPSGLTSEETEQRIKEEFIGLVKILSRAGIETTIYRQDDNLVTPDAIFPNNWFSTMPDGTLILYPMMAENRRLERRPVIINELRKKYSRLIDLSHDENRSLYLEGTGSLVIDHPNRIAYASLSNRTFTDIVFEWSKRTGYAIEQFTSYDQNGQTIYHTNVMMCLGGSFAILCTDAIADEEGRDRIKQSLVNTGREVIEINFSQMHHFCGNCLELENKNGELFLLMSSGAFIHFRQEQKDRITKYATIIHTPLDTIETVGGGSARCMVAELF